MAESQHSFGAKWEKATCPECGGGNAAAFGPVYTMLHRGSGKMRLDALGDEPVRGSGRTIEMSQTVLRGQCDDCGHRWGPLAERDDFIREAQAAAPESAVAVQRNGNWLYLWDADVYRLSYFLAGHPCGPHDFKGCQVVEFAGFGFKLKPGFQLADRLGEKEVPVGKGASTPSPESAVNWSRLNNDLPQGLPIPGEWSAPSHLFLPTSRSIEDWYLYPEESGEGRDYFILVVYGEDGLRTEAGVVAGVFGRRDGRFFYRATVNLYELVDFVQAHGFSSYVWEEVKEEVKK